MFLKKTIFIFVIVFILGFMSFYVWAQQGGSEQVTVDRIYYKLEEIAGQLREASYDQINKKLDQIIQGQQSIQEELNKIKMRQRY